MDVFSEEFKTHIFNVNFEFYELVYKDEWLKKMFVNIAQEVITQQQTDFVIQAFGGPANYCGRMPADAHPHLFVTEKMWERREQYLMMAFEKLNTPEEIRNKWLKIDNAFKNIIVKKSFDQLSKRFFTDEFIIVSDDE